MGCGMSRSHLLDEGVAAFGSRNPFHHKTHSAPPKLFINDSPIVNNPPALQKINTTDHQANHLTDGDDGGRTISNSDDDSTWFGSPSFREYIRSGPRDDDAATTGHEEQGKETAMPIGTHGGENMTCNREVCLRGGRFRKVFQVHRVSFWHSGPWHVGHPKPITKAA